MTIKGEMEDIKPLSLVLFMNFELLDFHFRKLLKRAGQLKPSDDTHLARIPVAVKH